MSKEYTEKEYNEIMKQYYEIVVIPTLKDLKSQKENATNKKLK